MGTLAVAQTVVLVAIALVAVAMLRSLYVREPDRSLAKVIVVGLLAKLAGTAARFTFMAELYGGRGDFNRYFENGVNLAWQIRAGSLPDQARTTGTGFMDFLSGVVYAVLPNALWVGFIVFSVLSFVGAVLFVYAFRLALPEGDHHRYAALIFFVPTMVFWPSSLGKEAWLVFTLGLSAYGAARVLKRARFGYLVAALGMVGVFVIRPHMAALFAVSLVAAYLVRFRDPTIKHSVVAWMLGFALVGLGAGYTFVNFADELPRDESVEGTATDQVFAETARRTTTGGSEYDSRPVRGPGDFVHAAITVPFRPFPTEGHNRQAQLAGFEGVVLLLLITLSAPRLASLPRTLLRRPYVALVTAYSIGFIIAFSNVGNFGLLTRQRAQLLPFLLVLLALPAGRELAKRIPVRGPVLIPTTLQQQRSWENDTYARPQDRLAHEPESPAADPPARRGSTELVIDLPPDTFAEGSSPAGGSSDS